MVFIYQKDKPIRTDQKGRTQQPYTTRKTRKDGPLEGLPGMRPHTTSHTSHLEEEGNNGWKVF